MRQSNTSNDRAPRAAERSAESGPPQDPGLGTRPRRVAARYLLLAWLCLAAMIAYVQRNGIGVAESTIRQEFGLTKEQMGWILSSFFWTYALFQVPSGWMCDQYGARRSLAVLCVIWSLASGAMSLAVGYHSLLASRYICGAAQAGIFPCSMMALSQWMPIWQRGLAGGWLASFMSVGAVVASSLTGWLIDTCGFSWQSIFVMFAVPGIVWSIGFYLWFRDRPSEHPSVDAWELAVIGVPEASTNVRPVGEATPWRRLATSAAMWAICGQQFFRAAGYIFYATWFPTYLQETRNATVVESGIYASLPLLGVVVGSLIGGSTTDWVLLRTGSRRFSRQGVATASMLLCGMLIVATHFIANAVAAALMLSLASFWAAFGGPCGYAITIDMGGRHVGTVFSVMNMAGNVGAAATPIVFERVYDWAGNWNPILFVLAGIYFAAAGCWLALNPAGSVFDTPESASQEG